MVFRRRNPAKIHERLRELVWPRRGFSRGLHYLTLRIVRLSSSPHSIAIGVAAGAGAAATPFIGFHILIALALAYMMSGNMIAAGIATALANPLTIPLILATIYEIGVEILGSGGSGALSGEQILHSLTQLQLSQLWDPLLKPMLVGTPPFSAACALVFYVATFSAARLFQSRRQMRLVKRKTPNLAVSDAC